MHRSEIHISPPPLIMIFFPLLWYSNMYSSWTPLPFCPFCIYFTLLTSISPLSFLFLSFSITSPLFSLPSFDSFPAQILRAYFLIHSIYTNGTVYIYCRRICAPGMTEMRNVSTSKGKIKMQSKIEKWNQGGKIYAEWVQKYRLRLGEWGNMASGSCRPLQT